MYKNDRNKPHINFQIDSLYIPNEISTSIRNIQTKLCEINLTQIMQQERETTKEKKTSMRNKFLTPLVRI